MPDKTKNCIECGQDFVLTEGEQNFFASKKGEGGRPYEEPKRCKDCRAKRKAEKEQQRSKG